MSQPAPEVAEAPPVYANIMITVTHPPVETMTEAEKRHLGLIA